jgi:hypothetical protein
MAAIGERRPRCNKCHREVQRTASGGWRHADPTIDDHLPVNDLGIVDHNPHPGSYKAEVDKALAKPPRGRISERSPGTTPKKRPEDWEYS